jgi:hypothetical protein
MDAPWLNISGQRFGRKPAEEPLERDYPDQTVFGV